MSLSANFCILLTFVLSAYLYLLYYLLYYRYVTTHPETDPFLSKYRVNTTHTCTHYNGGPYSSAGTTGRVFLSLPSDVIDYPVMSSEWIYPLVVSGVLFLIALYYFSKGGICKCGKKSKTDRAVTSSPPDPSLSIITPNSHTTTTTTINTGIYGTSTNRFNANMNTNSGDGRLVSSLATPTSLQKIGRSGTMNAGLVSGGGSGNMSAAPQSLSKVGRSRTSSNASIMQAMAMNNNNNNGGIGSSSSGGTGSRSNTPSGLALTNSSGDRGAVGSFKARTPLFMSNNYAMYAGTPPLSAMTSTSLGNGVTASPLGAISVGPPALTSSMSSSSSSSGTALGSGNGSNGPSGIQGGVGGVRA